jgi:RNA polymerase sigma factor (sigma-70 family)
MSDDTELLRRFTDDGAQDAFTVLVQRKVNLVYGAALRQVGGDTHLAQDVTQTVFFALACRAGALKRHVSLTGWLYTTTRFVALKVVRSQARWQRHEKEANTMSTPLHSPDQSWNELRLVIDDVMHELTEKDRTALLLRFFDGKPLTEVGAALGLAENAARMRVERALEKLRGRLARRGITSAAAALGATLAAQPAVTVPAGLVASAAGASLAGIALTGGEVFVAGLWLPNLMSTTKLILGSAGVVAALGLGVFIGAHYQNGMEPLPLVARANTEMQSFALVELRENNQRLKTELARLASAPSLASAATNSVGAPISAPPLAALDRLRVLTDLKKRKLVSPSITFVDRNGSLAPAFTEMFALTPAEKEILQRAVDGARDRLADLERENATIEQSANGDVVITVKPFPVAGGAAYDQLTKTFGETLGADRQNSFLVLGVTQVEKTLGYFGAADRRFVFSQNVSAGSDALYTVTESYQLPTESGSSSSPFKSHDELVRSIWPGTIVRLVPEYFYKKK